MAETSSNSKLMGILSYLSILVLIPIFAAKDDKFARYHANQGATLCVIGLAISVAEFIIGFILGILNIGIITLVWNLVTWLISVAMFVLVIIGIINVCKGECKELPVVGKFGWNLADKLAK